VSAELVQESPVLTSAFRQMNPVDEERPTKRRRTLPEAPGAESYDVYGELKVILNGSSPDSPVLHLRDLHQTVQ
jgi:serine/threonine-protein kinase ATR